METCSSTAAREPSAAPIFRPELPTDDAVLSIVAGALDAVDYPMLVLDDGARLLWRNRAAAAWLGRGQGLALAANGVVSWTDERLQRDFRAACALAWQRGLRRWLVAQCDGRRVAVAVLPLAAGAGRQAALVMLGRERLCPRLSLDRFAQATGLTDAEAEVMSALAEGCGPTDIARRHRVAMSTVRTQISCVRAKTGAHSIRDLIVDLATLPPMVAVVDVH